jgi:CRP/FNR family transcriptional regulator, polysaccharide utilization system transcription regulator
MKKILVIEDNKDVRENTSEILELAGYNVSMAANGKEGVSIAITEKPDIIICDIMMPELDGYGVLHMLNKNPETNHIPFIFLTAKTERSDMRKGMEMGADDYLTKPFDDIELLNAIASRLKKSEALASFSATTRTENPDILSKIKSLEEITNTAQRKVSKHFRKRDLIFNEGDSPLGLYLLNSGKVKVYKSHEVGKDLITRLLQPGDFFGYLPLLEGKEHSSSAEALEDCEVTIFQTEDFLKLIEHSPMVAQQLIKMLAGNLLNEQEHLLALAYSSVRKRTAEALITLKNRYSTSNSEPFSMAIGREDLAKIVGTATESLIRTLSDFREEKLIQINGSTITLLNAAKLEKLRS